MVSVTLAGIDSATFDVIDPLIEKGELKNFSILKKNGVSAKLKSTFPPVTPPAWTSFMTGTVFINSLISGSTPLRKHEVIKL